eukprot:CFRG5405T1
MSSNDELNAKYENHTEGITVVDADSDSIQGGESPGKTIAKQPESIHDPKFGQADSKPEEEEIPGEPYETGFFGCFTNLKVCLLNSFCFPCVGAQVHGAVQKQGPSIPVCCCLTCFPIGGGCMRRRMVVNSYNREEGNCKTCLVVTFCACCAQGQDYLEAVANGDL